jgi:hypothetical protein
MQSTVARQPGLNPRSHRVQIEVKSKSPVSGGMQEEETVMNPAVTDWRPHGGTERGLHGPGQLYLP